MSDKQNVIIAEWMGWEFDERWGCLVPPGHAGPGEMFTPYKIVDDSEDDWHLSRKLVDENWKGGITRTGSGRPIIPEFSTDLNAMASALKVVKERRLGDDYSMVLTILLFGEPVNSEYSFHLIAATAAEQAEALCRLIAQEKE